MRTRLRSIGIETPRLPDVVELPAKLTDVVRRTSVLPSAAQSQAGKGTRLGPGGDRGGRHSWRRPDYVGSGMNTLMWADNRRIDAMAWSVCSHLTTSGYALTGFATGLLAILIAAEPATSTEHEYPALSHWGCCVHVGLWINPQILLSVSNFAQSSRWHGAFTSREGVSNPP
jgi:hypothetical protein